MKSKTLKLYPVVVGLFVVGLFSLAFGTIAAQFSWGESTGNNYVQKEFPLEDIDTLINESTAEIEIIQGDKELIVASGKQSYVNDAVIVVTSHAVTIKHEKRPKLRFVLFHNDGFIKYTVYVKNLKQIENNGVGSFQIDRFVANSLQITNKGVGDMNFSNFKAINTNISIEGTGAIDINGESNSLNAVIDGVGALEAFGLSVNDCEVTLRGVGSAEVLCDKTMKGFVYGVGSIDYRGNALVEKTIRGLGSIDKQ